MDVEEVPEGWKPLPRMAEELHEDPRKLREWARGGRISAVRCRGRYYLNPEAVPDERHRILWRSRWDSRWGKRLRRMADRTLVKATAWLLKGVAVASVTTAVGALGFLLGPTLASGAIFFLERGELAQRLGGFAAFAGLLWTSVAVWTSWGAMRYANGVHWWRRSTNRQLHDYNRRLEALERWELGQTRAEQHDEPPC